MRGAPVLEEVTQHETGRKEGRETRNCWRASWAEDSLRELPVALEEDVW